MGDINGTGNVFYGGLIGFLMSFVVLEKYILSDSCSNHVHKGRNYEILSIRAIDLAVVTIPLFHFWGRLGCFFGGCCFGKEYHGMFSVLYTTKVMGTIDTMRRIPIQLAEAAFNIVIFFTLMMMLSKNKFAHSILISYFVMYAPLRFFLEIFRGDDTRGVYYGVSFSQAVSVMILILSAFYLKSVHNKLIRGV
jgi:phosphatidylglycerol:prolipoprotein diacylglycerol transferase